MKDNYCHLECKNIHDNIKKKADDFSNRIIANTTKFYKFFYKDIYELFMNRNLKNCELLKNILLCKNFRYFMGYNYEQINYSKLNDDNYKIVKDFLISIIPRYRVFKHEIKKYICSKEHKYYNYLKIFLNDETLYSVTEKYAILSKMNYNILSIDHKKLIANKNEYYRNMSLKEFFEYHDKNIKNNSYGNVSSINILRMMFENRHIIKKKDAYKLFFDTDNTRNFTINVSKLIFENMNFKIDEKIIRHVVRNMKKLDDFIIEKIMQNDNRVEMLFKANIKIVKVMLEHEYSMKKENLINNSRILNICEKNHYVINEEEKYYYNLNKYFLIHLLEADGARKKYDENNDNKNFKIKYKNRIKKDIPFDTLMDLMKSINRISNGSFYLKNMIKMMMDMEYDIDKQKFRMILIEHCKWGHTSETITKLFDYVFGDN